MTRGSDHRQQHSSRERRRAGNLVPVLTGVLVAGGSTLALVGLPASVAGAATDMVTTCAASGAGSLPVVVAAASAGDTVTFSVVCPQSSPVDLTSTVTIGVNLTIDGTGASTDAVGGGGTDGIFHVTSGVTATISGLTLTDADVGIDNAGTTTLTDSTVSDSGSSSTGGIENAGTLTLTASTLSDNLIGPGNGFGGGGIYNNGGTVTVSDSTLSDNAAANGVNGGGIYNNGGTVTVIDSTLAGNNTGDGSGGGIYNNGGSLSVSDSTLSGNSAIDNNGGGIDNDKGTVTVADSTLTHNTASYSADGGGIYNHGSLTVTNSTLSGNGAKFGGVGGAIDNTGTAAVTASIVASSSAGDDCAGAVTDGGYNLDDDGSCGFTAATDLPHTQADLDSRGLESNGGPTQTIALEASSPAIGAVTDSALCTTDDQTGTARPTPCDMGAVDVVLAAQAITSADSAGATIGAPFSFTVTTTGLPVPTLTKKGKLPKGVTFVNKHNGTAVISGVPGKVGTYTVTVKAAFGKGKTGHSLTQSFTVTVDPAP